jgi:hypothetical protein
MGLRNLPFWGRVATEMANAGLDRLGAKRCAVKGHRWRDIGAIVLHDDGGVEELERGAMQRCRRCGEVRPQPVP